MKRIKSSWVIGFLLLTGGLCGNISAETSEEVQLKSAQMEIDQHAKVWPNDEHVKALATYFKVPVSAVEEVSKQNQGWGAVTVELAMAWELSTMHSAKNPFMTGSLNRVEALRADGQGWGEIAKKLEFELRPVVFEAQARAKQLREDDLALTQMSDESSRVAESRRIIREEHLIAQASRADHR